VLFRSHYSAPIKETDVQNGKIAVRRAKPHEFQIRLDILPPDPQQVVLEGTKVEVYYPTSNTIQPVLLGKANKGMIEQFSLLGWGSTSAELKSAYAVTYEGAEEVVGAKTSRIQLIPKDRDLLTDFPKFELWISDATGLAVQQKIYLRGGDYNLLTCTNMKLQAPPESAVKLTAPKDAHREKPIK
jgi:outer membrane lipoprotein-sorting protein